MTRTDTSSTADEQDPNRCICWDDPDDESDRYCQHCADLLDEYERREYERAVARAWDEARQASSHDWPGHGRGSPAAAPPGSALARPPS